MRKFLIGLFREVCEYVEKYQFYMLLYSGINFILLLALNYNFETIKKILKEIIEILKIIDIKKAFGIARIFGIENISMVILIFLMIISIIIIPYRIVNKGINKLVLFGYYVILFQILSISHNTVNTNIIGLVFLLSILLFLTNLISNKMKNNVVQSLLNFFICIVMVLLVWRIFESQKDICLFLKIVLILFVNDSILNGVKKGKIRFLLNFVVFIIITYIVYYFFKNEIGIIENETITLKQIYFIFRLIIIPPFLIIIFSKIFSSKENYDLEKIEKKMHNKNTSFNPDKIKLIEENKGDFNYGDKDIKDEFIYNIKKKYSQEYNIIYKNRLYYLNDCHLKLKIRMVILWKMLVLWKRYNMVIIDNVEKNEINKFEEIRKHAKLITLNTNNKLFPSRIESIKKLEKEIELGKDSILVDNIWGNGKTFFIKKFMKEYEKKYEFIYIKVPYFDTKTEFRKKILSEIDRIFKKNKIITSSLKDLMSYFNVNDEGIKLGFINFNFNKLLSENSEDDYREVLINIKDNLNYLEKKVVLILDDFDRIETKEQILEVLNFIGELNIELNESIVLITLSSYEKLADIIGENVNKKEGKKCLEKYFDKIFYLPNSNLFELIDFFSDVYDISTKKKETMKEIINSINKYDEKLLIDEEINFRNVERLIKSIKEINIENQEYDIIYEKAYVFWEVVEYLIPNYWDKLKKYEPNLEDTKNIKEPFYNNILLELKWRSKLDKINLEKREEFVLSVLESVKKYKLGEYDEPISYYLSIKNEMLKNEKKYKFKDYQAVSQIFNFEIDERKEIFNFLMDNLNINRYETLELMISYKLNYNWKYKNSMEFLKDLENKEEGELPSNERTNRKFYIFLKKLLLINLFIDINKMKKLEEQEKGLYRKNDATGYFLKSNEDFLDFFISFLRKGIGKEEYSNFVQEICKMRKNTEQNIVDDDVKANIESLKLELINVKYLKEDLSEDLKEIEFLKMRLKNLNKKEKDEILNFLKEKDESLYEMWIDYLIPK